MEDLAGFREATRQWLEAHCPPALRTPAGGDEEGVWGGRRAVWPSPEAKRWLEAMADRGWTAPTWPRAYGGGGLTETEARVLEEEMRALGCRAPLKSLGLWMLGPVLLRYGTEAQMREHLPPIARGAIRWCQGYSEPEAGSDLASLRTRALRDGDDFVVTGQKVWTSHAHLADWMFCLVRTDPGASKHAGIGFLLVDLASPGITVKPLRLISGSSPFCETFFDGVRVPARNLVGAPGQGWEVAKAVLEHERALISRARDAAAEEDGSLVELGRRYLGTREGALADPVLRDAIARCEMDALASRLTLRRAADGARAGRPPGPETSLFKYYGTELSKRRRELMVSLAGFQGLGWEGPGFTGEELALTRAWLRSRASSIEGGTSEIQLNIIAKRVLGLPD